MLTLGLFKFALVILIIFCIWFIISRLVFRIFGIKDESFMTVNDESLNDDRLNAEIAETVLLVNGR